MVAHYDIASIKGGKMNPGNSCAAFDEAEIAELRAIAKLYREASGPIVKLSGMLGDKIESVVSKVPEGWQAAVEQATDIALRTAYATAAGTQAEAESRSYLNTVLAKCGGDRWHQVAASVSGAVGGIGGLGTLAIDLSVTTTLILRSIQEIAMSHGEDILDEAVRLQCIGVFVLGGPLTEDDEVETGLFAARLTLRGKTLETMLRTVVPRVLPIVTAEAAAKSMPVISAAVGAVLNPAFTSYYQKMAHVHFRLRRLEREHDADAVKACFERVLADLRQKARQPRG